MFCKKKKIAGKNKNNPETTRAGLFFLSLARFLSTSHNTYRRIVPFLFCSFIIRPPSNAPHFHKRHANCKQFSLLTSVGWGTGARVRDKFDLNQKSFSLKLNSLATDPHFHRLTRPFKRSAVPRFQSDFLKLWVKYTATSPLP